MASVRRRELFTIQIEIRGAHVSVMEEGIGVRVWIFSLNANATAYELRRVARPLPGEQFS